MDIYNYFIIKHIQCIIYQKEMIIDNIGNQTKGTVLGQDLEGLSLRRTTKSPYQQESVKSSESDKNGSIVMENVEQQKIMEDPKINNRKATHKFQQNCQNSILKSAVDHESYKTRNSHKKCTLFSSQNCKSHQHLQSMNTNLYPPITSLPLIRNNMINEKSLKIPELIKQSIRKKTMGRPAISSSKLSKPKIQSQAQIKANKFMCQICACEYVEDNKTKIGKCAHEFCDSCLRLYVDYKIARFQQVTCRAQNCQQTMETHGSFYQGLNNALKQKNKKIQTFYRVAKDKNIRLCPNQECKQGILTIVKGAPLKCNQCDRIYCASCFLPTHKDSCEKNEVYFFQNNFNFRRCNNCKRVVEKKQGCIHIKCLCKYEFCYLCGGRWTGYDHRCGTFPSGPQSQCDSCCQCIHGIGGNGISGQLVRLLIKTVVCFPLFATTSIFLLCVFLSFTVLLFLGAILLGIFPYTCQIIYKAKKGVNVLIALIYPLTMIW